MASWRRDKLLNGKFRGMFNLVLPPKFARDFVVDDIAI